MASRSETRLEETGDIDLDEELESIEQAIDRVKVLYEQHFMGIQKMPPETLHRQIERRMIKLTQMQMRNTAHRFRFTTLSQKYGAYNTYWRRTMRAIEQGRYLPHLATAARRQQDRGHEVPEEILAKMPKRLRDRILRDRARVGAWDERRRARDEGGDEAAVVRQPKPHRHDAGELAGESDFDFDAMFDAIRTDDKGAPAKATPEPAPPPKPAPPPQPPPQPPPPRAQAAGTVKPTPPTVHPERRPRNAGPESKGAPAPAPEAKDKLPPGMTEQQTRQLFEKFVQAKKLVGERTDDVSYAKLLGTLNKQAPAIMKQHGAKAVDFQVVIKDDKVVLKARPKK